MRAGSGLVVSVGKEAFAELQARGEPVSLEGVQADLRARDERDQERAVAPLHPAADALLLDTSELDIETAFQAVLDLVKQAMMPSNMGLAQLLDAASLEDFLQSSHSPGFKDRARWQRLLSIEIAHRMRDQTAHRVADSQ